MNVFDLLDGAPPWVFLVLVGAIYAVAMTVVGLHRGR
jgi:hypothetical protein